MLRVAVVSAGFVVAAGCVAAAPASDPPRFLQQDYLDLDKIDRISRFRSGVGHDYADDFESCRSMKHYFVPREDVDPASIVVRSPVDGTVRDAREEWAGTQLVIVPRSAPEFAVVLFHVRLARELAIGEALAAGERLGTHVGRQTWSDVAVERRVAGGRRRLVSYFDVLPDDLLARYRARGVASREALVASAAERDAAPFACGPDGRFLVQDPDGWVTLEDG